MIKNIKIKYFLLTFVALSFLQIEASAMEYEREEAPKNTTPPIKQTYTDIRRTPASPARYVKDSTSKNLKEEDFYPQEEFFKRIFKKAENIYGPYEQITSRFPQHLFPILPESYRWSVQDNGKYVVECYNDTIPRYVEFVVYGPDKTNKVNYLTLFDGQNHQSFSHTRSETYKGAKPGYDFYELLGTPASGRATRSTERLGKRFLDGHCIDTADTMTNNPFNESTSRKNDSNIDPKNHIPEPTETKWGKNIRQSHVRNLRRDGGSYMQFPYYNENPILTNINAVLCNNIRQFDNKYVPEGVYFVDVDDHYNITASYDIAWDDPIHKWVKNNDHAKDQLQKRGLKTWGLVPFVYHPDSFNNTQPSSALAAMTQGNKSISDIYSGALTFDELKRIQDLNYMELYSLNTAATNEFESTKYKILLASYLITRQSPKVKEAQLWEKRAAYHATFLQEWDITLPIITDIECLNIQSSFRTDGFDSNDDKYDFWRQIYSNQKESNKDHLHKSSIVFIKPEKMEKTTHQNSSFRTAMRPEPLKALPQPLPPPKLYAEVPANRLKTTSSKFSIFVPKLQSVTPSSKERSSYGQKTPTHSSLIAPEKTQYSEENYQKPLEAMEKQLSPSKITRLTGYSGLNERRDLKPMNQADIDPGLIQATSVFSKLPLEIQAHIFSFLEQWDFLKASGVSQSCREAACIVGENKTLNLSRRMLKSKDCQTLLRVHFSSLTLQNCHLGPEEVRILSQFSRIKSLDLANNNIGDVGAKYIATGNLIALTYLNLENNNIGNSGREALKNSLRNITISFGQVQFQYSDRNYQTLISNLEKKVDANQITKWAGYCGTNGKRDLATMRKQQYGDKQGRWDKLVMSLIREKKDISSFM